jgi:Leucine-rich repeat (LRR) protein
MNSNLSDDIWREIARFHVSSLSVFHELLTVSKRFRSALSHPLVLSHCLVRLREPSELFELGHLASRVSWLKFLTASDYAFGSAALPPTLTRLDLRYCDISELGLKSALRGQTNLTDLDLTCCGIEDLSCMHGLPLKTLSLGGGYNDLWHADKLFATLPDLGALDVNSVSFCEDPFDRANTQSPCVVAISRLSNLHTLILDAADLRDREFVQLEPLRASLKRLSVTNTNITDKSARVLGCFLLLEHLSVQCCRLSKRSMRAISKLVNLRTLYATVCMRMVRNSSMRYLRSLVSLEILDISSNPVNQFESLHGLSKLRALDVTDCNSKYADADGRVVLEKDIEPEQRSALINRIPNLFIGPVFYPQEL